MTIETDVGGGRAVGSRMRLAGRVLGIDLAVEGEVTERKPPLSEGVADRGRPAPSRRRCLSNGGHDR